MAKIEVKVPDIGDFKNVPIIEILVKPGDRVTAEQPLLTLESDKATMDVPAPAAGVVGEIVAKVGDKVSKGTALLTLDEAGAAAPAPAPAPAPAAPVAPVESAPASAAPAPVAPVESAPRPPRPRRPRPARLWRISPASTPVRRRAGWRANSASI